MPAAVIDSLLAERFSIATSVRLMEHAATLDLQDFEDSESQDKLERARRQASGRMALMSQLFSEAQDAITILSFAAGLALFTPWLIALLLLALIPSFLGEAHFSAQGYALAYTRTADQRSLDYRGGPSWILQTAADHSLWVAPPDHPRIHTRDRDTLFGIGDEQIRRQQLSLLSIERLQLFA